MRFRTVAPVLAASLVAAAASLVSAEAHAAGEVTLARAFSSEICAEGLTSQHVSYAVYVKNLGYAKTVTIHGKNADGTWSDVPAHFVESGIGNGLELWEASATAVGSPHDLQFAVSYTVNNATYWDSNGGRNYSVGADDGALFGAGTKVLTSYAYASGSPSGFYGQIEVANVAYAKAVSVVYTTDGWATTHVIPAQFRAARPYGCGDYDSVASPNAEGIERWTFSAPTVTASAVTFAVSYTVNGATYWDSNLGSNYVATASGTNGAGQE